MGLLDKAAASGSEDPKPKAKAVAKAKPVAKAKAKAKPVKAKRAAKVKKEREPRARRWNSGRLRARHQDEPGISSLVNFFINFGVPVALFIASADTSIRQRSVRHQRRHHHPQCNFHPNEIQSQLGPVRLRTKYVRGDGTNPLFLHGILVNTAGLFPS